MIRAAASLFLVLAVTSCASAPHRDPAWKTSLADAQRVAATEKKPILMDFTGSDWCTFCKKLHAEVLDTPEFMAWAQKRVVLVELDYPRVPYQSSEEKKQNADLAKKYTIAQYPTVIFADADGKEIGRTGYSEGGAAAWIANAEKILAQHGG
jgi:protein disulfide-isomerase